MSQPLVVNGLYVTQKNLAGFTVVENAGGRSTIPFGYRIVARPYGVTGSRLPMVDTTRSTEPVFKRIPPMPKVRFRR